MKIFSILAFLCAFLSLGSEALAAQVIADVTSLRSGPSKQDSIIEKLQKGDILKIVERQGDWVLAESENNHVGWIQVSAVKEDPESPSKFLPSETEGAATRAAAATAAPASPAPTTIAQPEQAKTVPQESSKPESAKSEANLTKSEYVSEFHELSLSIRPAYAWASKHPAGMDTSGFSIGGHVGIFFRDYLGVHVPYTYTHFGTDQDFHSVGAGPIFRFLDQKYMRATA